MEEKPFCCTSQLFKCENFVKLTADTKLLLKHFSEEKIFKRGFLIFPLVK